MYIEIIHKDDLYAINNHERQGDIYKMTITQNVNKREKTNKIIKKNKIKKYILHKYTKYGIIASHVVKVTFGHRWKRLNFGQQFLQIIRQTFLFIIITKKHSIEQKHQTGKIEYQCHQLSFVYVPRIQKKGFFGGIVKYKSNIFHLNL